MLSRVIVLALSVVSLLVLPAHAATTQVAIRDSAYDPPTTTVAVGDTVTWTNHDAVDHTATADNEAFDSKPLSTGDSYSHRFGSAGTFAYHCTIHPGMRGTVTVQAAGGTSSTTSTSLATTTTTSSTTTTTRPSTTTTTTSTTTTTTTSTTLVEETTTTTTADESTTTTTAEVAAAVQAPAGDDDEPSHAGPTAFAALLLASVAGGAALALKRGL